MGGLTRFERRWSGWIRMRDLMHWRAYDAHRTASLRKAALTFLAWMTGFISSLAIVTMALAAAHPAHAQDQADAIPRSANHYKLTLKREAQRVWGINAPVATFAAQVHQESRWRLNAISPAGAHGLAQFMPTTAEWISELPGAQLQGMQTGNPTWSLRALVTYDLWLSRRIHTADPCEQMAFTLSAYNGGLGWVYKRQRISRQPDVCMGQTCTLNPGIAPAAQRENERYPRLILLRYEPLYRQWGSGSCL